MDSELLNYKKLCEKHNSIELNIIKKQFGNPNVVLEEYNFTENDIFCFLEACSEFSLKRVNLLNLSGNRLTEKNVNILGDYIKRAHSLISLNLKNCLIPKMNLISPSFVQIQLHFLNLSGNTILNDEVETLVVALKNQTKLETLNLSRCELDSFCAMTLAKYLETNESIKFLDLSWNNIANIGSLELALIFKKNQTIEQIDLSMNGFADYACKEFANSLCCTNSLNYLNLANNHINKSSLNYLLNGLYGNSSITTLILTGNPLDMDCPVMIAKMMTKSPSSVLNNVEIENLVVNEKFKTLYNELKQTKNAIFLYKKEIYGKSKDDKFNSALIGTDPMLIIAEAMRQKNLRIIDFFQLADEFKNKALTWENISSVINKMHIHLSKDNINVIMEAADDNNDGEISFQELHVVIESARKRLNELKRLEKQKDHISMVIMSNIRNIVRNCAI